MTEPNEEATVVETAETQTVVVTTPAPAETAAGGDLGKVRELVLKAHPDVVPDLVRGGSVEELIASVEPARSAYQRIADQVRESSSREGEQSRSQELAKQDDSSTPRRHDSSPPQVVQPPLVPAGGATNEADPGEFAPTTRIAQALAARKNR
jgi:hypothetical protein